MRWSLATTTTLAPSARHCRVALFTQSGLWWRTDGRDVAVPVDRLALQIYYDASAGSLCWCCRSDGKTQSTSGSSHRLMSHAVCSSDTDTQSSSRSFVSQRTILRTLAMLSQFHASFPLGLLFANFNGFKNGFNLLAIVMAPLLYIINFSKLRFRVRNETTLISAKNRVDLSSISEVRSCNRVAPFLAHPVHDHVCVMWCR